MDILKSKDLQDGTGISEKKTHPPQPHPHLTHSTSQSQPQASTGAAACTSPSHSLSNSHRTSTRHSMAYDAPSTVSSGNPSSSQNHTQDRPYTNAWLQHLYESWTGGDRYRNVREFELVCKELRELELDLGGGDEAENGRTHKIRGRRADFGHSCQYTDLRGG